MEKDMITNARILGAVLNKWAQPLVASFLGANIQSVPFMQGIQNKVRSMGWVSPNWSIMSEISPLMESVTGNIIAPMIERYVSGLDDASIPKMAHAIINDALKNGELSLFEGKVVFERKDLEQLKRLLDLNLPYDPNDDVIIKTE
jgi:hypothetical protein